MVVGLQVWVWVLVEVQAYIGDTDGVEQEWTCVSNRGQRSTPSIQALLLLVLNWSRSTLSNVNRIACVLYARSKSTTLRLMPPDEWGKRVEQLGLGPQLSEWLYDVAYRVEVRRLTQPAWGRAGI